MRETFPRIVHFFGKHHKIIIIRNDGISNGPMKHAYWRLKVLLPHSISTIIMEILVGSCSESSESKENFHILSVPTVC